MEQTEQRSQAANIPALQAQADAIAFIGIQRTREIAGFSKSSILRKIARGEFPAPVIHENNVVRWDLGEVLAWRRDRIRERDERRAKIDTPPQSQEEAR